MFHFSQVDGVVRQFGDVRMNNLVSGPGRPFSLSSGELSGVHPPTVSRLSDRAYYLVSGALSFTVGDERFEVAAGDVVLVPKGTKHAMTGTAHYVVVNAPPFDKDAEEVAQ